MKTMLLAAAALAAFVAGAAHAETISNPASGSNVGPLCGWPYQGGACQTVFIGESFAASTSGNLTSLQFSLLGGSTLTSVQAIVYALNGPLGSTFTPGAEIWRSAAVAGSSGLLEFNPVGVKLTAGQNYVAFLTTYYTTGTGQASVASCNVFIGGPACQAANANPSLGRAITGRALGANLDELTFTQVVNGSQDLTFSATITPVPEPASWALMLGGFGLIGGVMRRRVANVTYA
ncbi:PEPxxWA-CTERM sorting domain-containing protein [Sphingomonas sp. ID1715]|uniref:PEPxxWA-CTERM sorting domain-containing protein n=1 Tax=Sphingomonas sp. ID1715 TaxID=1656898 RepID=UPI0020C4F24B|nr:PEPxxWA-CTERM sorting domain-containing protein [Sphingomonas sp. ID1715]